jgi:hypothetical protein
MRIGGYGSKIGRNVNRECAAFAYFGLNLYMSTVLPDDRIGGGKTESRSVLLCCEKWIEYFAEMTLFNTVTFILYFD